MRKLQWLRNIVLPNTLAKSDAVITQSIAMKNEIILFAIIINDQHLFMELTLNDVVSVWHLMYQAIVCESYECDVKEIAMNKTQLHHY